MEGFCRKSRSDQLVIEAEKRASYQKRALNQQIADLRLSIEALEVDLSVTSKPLEDKFQATKQTLKSKTQELIEARETIEALEDNLWTRWEPISKQCACPSMIDDRNGVDHCFVYSLSLSLQTRARPSDQCATSTRSFGASRQALSGLNDRTGR